MRPQLEALVHRLGTIRLRKIDIASWDSEVAQQHDIRSIPQLWLYDGMELLSKDTREILEYLQRR